MVRRFVTTFVSLLSCSIVYSPFDSRWPAVFGAGWTLGIWCSLGATRVSSWTSLATHGALYLCCRRVCGQALPEARNFALPSFQMMFLSESLRYAMRVPLRTLLSLLRRTHCQFQFQYVSSNCPVWRCSQQTFVPIVDDSIAMAALLILDRTNIPDRLYYCCAFSKTRTRDMTSTHARVTLQAMNNTPFEIPGSKYVNVDLVMSQHRAGLLGLFQKEIATLCRGASEIGECNVEHSLDGRRSIIAHDRQSFQPRPPWCSAPMLLPMFGFDQAKIKSFQGLAKLRTGTTSRASAARCSRSCRRGAPAARGGARGGRWAWRWARRWRASAAGCFRVLRGGCGGGGSCGVKTWGRARQVLVCWLPLVALFRQEPSGLISSKSPIDFRGKLCAKEAAWAGPACLLLGRQRCGEGGFHFQICLH